MANEKILNTVIVLRHDTKEAWEADEAYVLRKGEIGIGYTSDNKVIVKAGLYDGETDATKKTWKELPQIEGVFEEDLTLTYAFGKYSPDASGSFELKTAGKTMSEVMLDAFAQEDFGQDSNKPIITGTPSALFTAVNGSSSGEVGTTHSNPKVRLDLTISGSYRYGCKNASDEGGKDTQANITATRAEIQYPSGTKVKEMDSNNPNGDLEYELSLTGDDLKYKDTVATYTFYAYANSGADANRPITNLGNYIVKDGNNYSGTKTFVDATEYIKAKKLCDGATVEIKFTGYRKMFMGAVYSHPESNINSAFIRESLTSISEKAATGAKDFKAVNGQCGFYVAIPTGFTTKAPVFKTEFNKEYIDFTGVEVYMGKDETGSDVWENISTATTYGTVNVNGADSYTAVPYRVYRYIPGTATGKFTASETKYRVTVSK